MKKIIQQILPAIEYICALSGKEQALHVKTLKKEAVKVLVDILFNVEKGVLSVNPDIVAQLKPYKRLILSMTKKSGGLKQRQKLLQKKGIFSKIFCPLLPVLRELVH